jgi:hypothetical protein
MAAANQGLAAPPENEDRNRSEMFGTGRCKPPFRVLIPLENFENFSQTRTALDPTTGQRLQIAAMPANTQQEVHVSIHPQGDRRYFHACMRVEFRNSGITYPIYCALLGSRAYIALIYLPTWNPTFAWLPPHRGLICILPTSHSNLPPLTKTNYHDILPPSIMSLVALILEALAGTVTILSTPKLLVDRVLAHLCRWPLPFSLTFASS